MIVLLKTRCGCQRVMEMPKGWMDYTIRIPLSISMTLVAYEGKETIEQFLQPTREFCTAGDYDDIGRMIFTEVEK